MEQKGIGIGINKWASTTEIVEAVNEVLYNQKYADNISKLSELMKIGMKNKPMQNAIWWLEYLSATKGAQHLKLSSRHLNFIQYYSLDFISLCVIILLFIVKIIVIIRSSRNKEKQD